MRSCCNKNKYFLRGHREFQQICAKHLFWGSGLNWSPVRVNADVFKLWIRGCNSWMKDTDEKFDDFSFDRLFFMMQSKTEWPLYHLLMLQWNFPPLLNPFSFTAPAAVTFAQPHGDPSPWQADSRSLSLSQPFHLWLRPNFLCRRRSVQTKRSRDACKGQQACFDWAPTRGNVKIPTHLCKRRGAWSISR